MAVPWPVSLPDKVNTSGFTFKKGDTTLRSDMDIKPEKVRRRTTAPVDLFTFVMDMSTAQIIIFEDFYDTDINGGVTPFEFNNPITGDLEEFRFTEPPSIVPLGSGGLRWTVTMNLERLP